MSDIKTEAIGSGSSPLPISQLLIRGRDRTWSVAARRSSIGAHESNAVHIDDPTVSRFHCELLEDKRGVYVRDLKSTNGTFLDGVAVREAYVKHGSRLSLGRIELSIELAGRAEAVPCSDRSEFGGLLGSSTVMRQLFTELELAASSDATVLLHGETGTGKEAAAEAIHRESARAEGPFVVVDLATVHPSLVESELFGHERGAFTGAISTHVGAFEEADGGTVFLDELGELPLDLQPRLLRVLEQRSIRRVGSSDYRPVDVRVIAATHRDLRTLTNEGLFREDLYYRLAVLCVELPALREHPDDMELLVNQLLTRLGADESARSAMVTDQFLARLRQGAWPGNVRELRNYLERCYVMGAALPLTASQEVGAAAGGVDPNISYHEARKSGIAEWERCYLDQVLSSNADKSLAAIARLLEIDRRYLYRLLERHGLRKRDG